jgi:DNA-binding transcriptional LysR family regulator
MDSSDVRDFVVVAQEQNLTRAADLLCVSQPALSLRLKKLQESLDVVLFERLPRGMRLTSAGRRLLPAAERVINATAEFRAAALRLKGQVTGSVRLGTILDPEFLRLGSCLRRLVERHPGLSFSLRHGMSGTMAREVEAGNLDVAFTLGAPGMEELRERFHVLTLTDFVYRVVAPPNWSSEVLHKGWRELASLPWIETPPDSVHHRLLKRIALDENIEFNFVAQVDLEQSMMDLVKSGVALTLARESAALQEAHAGHVVIADAVVVAAELGLLCRKDRLNDPSVSEALKIVAAVWSKETL